MPKSLSPATLWYLLPGGMPVEASDPILKAKSTKRPTYYFRPGDIGWTRIRDDQLLPQIEITSKQEAGNLVGFG